MQVIETSIPDVKVLVPRKFADARGFFSETFRQDLLYAAGISTHFVQDNHVHSAPRFVLRGLHYQAGAAAQAKLVRVVRGAIWDVAVDIRPQSPTFGRYVAVELTAENWKQIYVPTGFAHGYITLQPDTEVIYKVSHAYSPQNERGILWNDPELAIAWPVAMDQVVLSEKDKALLGFRAALAP